MKKILLVVSLGLFLGVASVSAAEMNTVHKTFRTEQKANKPVRHKKTHKGAHKTGMKRTASYSKHTQKGLS